MIQLFFFVLFCYLFGYAITKNIHKKNNLISSLPLSFLVGIFSQVLFAHLLALMIGSYRFCINIAILFTFIVLLLYLLFIKIKKKENFFEFEKVNTKFDYVALASSILLGISFRFRELVFGNPDCGHLAITSSIYENSIYPPYFPTGVGFSMSYYHYAVDLMLAFFKHVSGFSIWDITSFQISLGAFLTFLSAYTLFDLLVGKKLSVYLISIVLVFYTSINSLEYLARGFTKLGSPNWDQFLRQWLLVSWTSVSHITSQLRLTGQNMGLPLLFTFVCNVYRTIEEKYYLKLAKNIDLSYVLVLLSFALYFCYPTYWYPAFVSIGALLFFKFFVRAKEIKISDYAIAFLLLMFLIYSGKFLTFTSSHTSFDGINSMVLKPSLSWIHWGKAYIRYFYDTSYLQRLGTVLDHMNYTRHIEIPLFSSISFREFGSSFILAIVIFIKQVIDIFKTKKIPSEIFLVFISFSSFLVPFLFEFILRPIETSRFLLLAKVFALVYVLQYLAKKINFSKLNLAFRAGLLTLMFVFLVPGIVSVLPNKNYAILGNYALSVKEKELLTKLNHIHKDGDIILDTHSLGSSYDLANIAGYYGIGGQFFKYDKVTRLTALKTLDPALLKELNVRLIVLEKTKPEQYPQNLNRPYLKKLDFDLDDCIVLEFDKNYNLADDYQKSYLWVIGYQIAELNQIQIFKNSKGEDLMFDSRKIAAQLIPQLRASLAKSNPIIATWVKEYAVISK